MTARGPLLWLLAILVSLVFAPSAAAHQTGQATFVAHVKPETRQIDTLLACPVLDVAHAAQLEDPQQAWNTLGFYLDQHIEVTNDGERCKAVEHKLSPRDDPGTFWFLKAFECDKPLGQIELRNDAMTETEGGYSHIARVQLGEAVQTTVFTAQTPTFALNVARPAAPEEVSIGRFVFIGITHILGGWDHVLFVLALILLSRRLRELLIVVTAFTIAHSVTLALSVLDVVTIPPSIIEPIIALSIVWVAVEAVLDRGDGKRAYVATFLLGLVHGFGFAYVLREEVGLAADALLSALVSFNVGVELGQLGIVLVAYPLRRWMRGRSWERRAVIGIAVGIGIIALWWFVERALL